MTYPRTSLSAILLSITFTLLMMDATAQHRRDRQPSNTPIDETVQSRRGQQPDSNAPARVAVKPKPMTIDEHEAAQYEKTKKSLTERHEQWIKQIKFTETPNSIKRELHFKKAIFKRDNGREPNANELADITAIIEKKVAEHEEKLIKAAKEGFRESLAAQATYYADLKKTRDAKLAKLQADNERLRLPKNLDGMFVVMSSGAVLEVVDVSEKDKYYPYRMYLVHLSDYLRETGRETGELMGKAGYYYQTQSFNFFEAIDYSNAFDIPLNYELVKQACGTIYKDKAIEFKFQAPEGKDLTENNSVVQWRALASGLVYPYVEPDYANCRIKRYLKAVPNEMNMEFMRDKALAIKTAKRYIKEVASTRMTYAEHRKEMANSVAAINAKLRARKKQEQRTNSTRDRFAEDALINQFVIDQAWGRAPTEKPVW